MSHAIQMISQGSSLKAEGDAALKAGDCMKAVAKYTRVFAYLNGLQTDVATQAMMGVTNYSNGGPQLDEIQRNQVEAMLIAVRSNLCLAYSKLNQHEQVIKFATQVLATNPEHSKALFRRAVAYRELKQFDEARADIAQAAKLLPNDSAVRTEHAVLNQAIKEADRLAEEDVRQKFAGMYTSNSRK